MLTDKSQYTEWGYFLCTGLLKPRIKSSHPSVFTIWNINVINTTREDFLHHWHYKAPIHRAVQFGLRSLWNAQVIYCPTSQVWTAQFPGVGHAQLYKISGSWHIISHYRPGVRNTIKSITINILNRGFVI